MLIYVGARSEGVQEMVRRGAAADPKERARLFGDALRDALAVRQISQAALAKELGVEQPTVSGWIVGEAIPRTPDMAFAVEAFLELPPGSLVRHLGYLPPAAVHNVATVETAIAEDPGLAEADKEILLGAYRAALSARRRKPTRGRPRK